MSRHDYLASRKLSLEDHTFATLIMTAMRKADSENIDKLRIAFPDIAAEFKYRYWSGGGFMPGEDGYDPANDDNFPLTKEA